MDEVTELVLWAREMWADWLVHVWCVVMSNSPLDKLDAEMLWDYASICGTTM